LFQYQLSKTVIGLVFLLAGLIYTFTAPLIGYLVDHKNCTIETMIGGSLLASVAFTVFGPSPILRIPKYTFIFYAHYF
uniref:MFS domain-containing protein n=1 Tax=Soboliphyme baturini TaxID=241478 RepID=A0A183J4U4_9BILA